MLGIDLTTVPNYSSLLKQTVVSCLYNVNAISFYVAVTLPCDFEPPCPEEKSKGFLQVCTSNTGP